MNKANYQKGLIGYAYWQQYYEEPKKKKNRSNINEWQKDKRMTQTE